MKLTLVDQIGKAYGLDGNEHGVYSFIAQYSNGKGWFSTYARMAELLPFVVSEKTIERIVGRLTKLGLVERRHNALYTTTICLPAADKSSSQGEQVVPAKQTIRPAQTDKSSPIYNKEINKERQEENYSACDSLATPDSPTPSSLDNNPSSFNLLLKAYKDHNGKIALSADKLAACRELWNNKTPAEQQRLIREINNGNCIKDQLEWTIKDFHMPQPRNYNGDMSVNVNELAKTIPFVFACYNDVGGIYTLQDALDYQMVIKNDFLPLP